MPKSKAKPVKFPTKRQLRAIGMAWLRYERDCVLLCVERPVSWSAEFWKPDIYGVNKNRRSYEIEIKQTYSDFIKDREKKVWRYREMNLMPDAHIIPHYFYFLVPPKLVDRVKPELPEGTGLLTIGDINNLYTHLPDIWVIVPVKANPKATRISLRNMIRMTQNQSGSLCSMALELARVDPDPEPSEILPDGIRFDFEVSK